MEGVDLLTLKELGGWKSLPMVQRYAHLSPSHRRSAIERLVARPAADPAKAAGRSSTVIRTGDRAAESARSTNTRRSWLPGLGSNQRLPD